MEDKDFMQDKGYIDNKSINNNADLKNDADLRNLFAGFEPDLSSDTQFMRQLMSRLDSVELIKRHEVAMRARNRTATAIAAFVGFLAGCLLTLTLPYLNQVVSTLKLSYHYESILTLPADNLAVISWILIGCISALSAIYVYNLTMFIFQRREALTN